MVKIKRNGVFRIVPEYRVQKYLDKGYFVVSDAEGEKKKTGKATGKGAENKA